MPTDNAAIWWCHASTAATRRGGAVLRRKKPEERVSKAGQKDFANSLTASEHCLPSEQKTRNFFFFRLANALTFKIFSVEYARWECVRAYTISAQYQIIHDIFYRNFHVPVAVKKAVCHWITVHSFLWMHISLRKSNQIFVQDAIHKVFLAFMNVFSNCCNFTLLYKIRTYDEEEEDDIAYTDG